MHNPHDLPDKDIALLRERLAGYPPGKWFLDQVQDNDGDRPSNATLLTGNICRPSTEAELAGGADSLHEIGSLYPVPAAQLAAVAVNALPRLLDELERRRGEDRARDLFGENDSMILAVASVISDIKPGRHCPKCTTEPCRMHLARGLVHAFRDEKLLVLTLETANHVVCDLRERAEQAERERDDLRATLNDLAGQVDQRGQDADSHADGLALCRLADQIRELAGGPAVTR